MSIKRFRKGDIVKLTPACLYGLKCNPPKGYEYYSEPEAEFEVVHVMETYDYSLYYKITKLTDENNPHPNYYFMDGNFILIPSLTKAARKK